MQTVTVAFVPLRQCLINLPAAWTNALLDRGELPQNVVLEISWQDGSTEKKSYVGWSGSPSTGGSGFGSATPFTQRPGGNTGDTIEMDPQFGQAIGLRAGQKVNIDFVKGVQDGVSVNVAPYSEDDWEILELHAGYVEDQMLNQIRVLYPNQIFTMWVNNRTLVRLRVLDMNPTAQCVKLVANAEIIVAPMVRNVNGAVKATDSQDLSTQLQKVVQCLRVLALDECSDELTEGLSEQGPFTVQVHPESWIEADLSSQPALRISKVIPPHAEKAMDDEARDPEDLLVGTSAIYVKVASSHRVPLGHVAISKQVQDALDAENYSIVTLAESRIHATQLSSITLRPISTSGTSVTSPAPLKLQPKSASHDSDKAAKAANLTNIFKEWVDSLPDNDTTILSHGSLLSILQEDSVQSFSVVFPTKSLPSSNNGGANGNSPQEETKSQTDVEAYSILNKAQLNQLKVEIGQPRAINHVFKRPVNHILSTPAALGGVTQVFIKAEKYLMTCLSKLELRDAFAVPSLGGFLLCGPHGSGKTVVARSLIHKLSQNVNTLAYCVEINCAEFAEDRLPVLITKFQQWFDTAAFHSPSVLFLEDLDRLIPAEVEHADSFRSRQIAEVFLQIASKMCKRFDRIAVVATAQQQASVHPSLVTSHLFSEIIRLTPPGKTERKEMLQSLMESGPAILQRSLPQIDLVSVASKTEGYLAADLKAFLERAVHEGAVRNIASQTADRENGKEATNIADKHSIPNGVTKDPVPRSNDVDTTAAATSTSDDDFTLTQADFVKAQEGFVPSSLRGVKLQSSATSWLDIGGLNETRKILLETLEWPTKYASIFSQCPLRLRSGLLLFGHPGCGKTLLASAVAKECGLNFISVKGPELLNKYIGASEKSVRDLFERAQAAKPCVLFFDEFDSIAPKRGHDSTGVTDRVVNQMLTQMDGAEGLDGVYVLAATSRPDLIDPALLRPGRLDKSLLCGMPNFQDRHEILTCLARKMEVAEDVDLTVCARRTDGLTGADLQAVLYNAHLEAIRVAIEKDEAVKKERQNSHSGTGASSPVPGGTSSRLGDGRAMRFVSLGGKGFAGGGKASQKANLTQAERGLISQRLGLIAKGMTSAKETASGAGGDAGSGSNSADKPKGTRPIITNEHLEVSLNSTRPSITPEEILRLDLM
ncbi:Peroxisome biosynthesis protein pex1 [Mortierella sp. NVP85]|nr:Peroxisome biosynthesis protein pex1 [Mortierella sp. NVP85]